MSLLSAVKNNFQKRKSVDLSLDDYLDLCSKDKSAYANAAERMVKAIGEPQLLDTSKDPVLSRVFMNRVIRYYPKFGESFFGMDETIERIVNFFRFSAQGLEESKQVLYLLGPVGSAKSSIAEKLKELMELEPIYVLTYKGEMSPVFESVFGLLKYVGVEADVQKDHKIPAHVFVQNSIISPWALKRLEESEGDLSLFGVRKVYPDKLAQIAITKTEPGDENNQDISSLVGKVDIRKLEHFSQNDTDAYSYSGGLCRANQGLLEFVEMFKAPIKCLHPLLTATQERNYAGTENIGAIPFSGIVVAHSNEAEWQTFKNNKNNEAFIDRVCIIKVPYCLRVSEERKIYEKYINGSGLGSAPRAPGTLEMLARFSVLTRLVVPENSTVYSKMKIYDGESIKDRDPKAKSLQEYRDLAGLDEGMQGISTRFAFKVLSQTYNYDSTEVAADPVHLMFILKEALKREQFSNETENRYLEFITSYLAPEYAKFIGEEIQKAYIESYGDFGQSQFDRYIAYADAWLREEDFRDEDTGQMWDRSMLEKELEKIERPGNIINAKDFRQEVVTHVFRVRASGKNVAWNSYKKLAEVIEKKMFMSLDEMLPVISFTTKKDSETEKKHGEFLDRMVKRGYTKKQANRLVEWYVRANKNN
jgi:serine protein kinase